MKKIYYVVFIISLAMLVSAPVFAQSLNGQSIFLIDTDLTQAGFQGFESPGGIGAGELVGFAVYVNKIDELRAFNIDVTWDPSLASRDSDSDAIIEEDTVTINGQEITLAAEDNILGVISGLGEVKEDGHYSNDYAKLGGDAVVQEDFGLLYYFVLKTSSSFTTSTSLIVPVKITIVNELGVKRYIGQRYFYVNGAPTDVQESTWGELKNQFKDF